MDATAVAAARGYAAAAGLRFRDAAALAVSFGVFQTVMPLLGWLLGSRVSRFSYLEAIDHWIAFALLTFLGVKMIREARSRSTPAAVPSALALGTLLTLSIATSIDALVAGVTLPLLELPLWLSAATIGVVTMVLSLGGAYVGRGLGATVGSKLEWFGGLLLIAIGARTVIEHLLGDGRM